MFGFSSPNLTELHTALIEDSLESQLEKSILASFESGLTQLPVCRNELRHHGAGLLKTLYSGCAWVPVLGDKHKRANSSTKYYYYYII